MRLRSTFGFGLIEVMVALGITTIAIAGVGTAVKSLSVAQRTKTQVDEADVIVQSIDLLLSEQATCVLNFGPTSGGGAIQLSNADLVRPIVDGNGAVVYDVGNPVALYGNNKIALKVMRFSQVGAVNAVAPYVVTGTLLIGFTRQGSGYGGDFVKRINMRVELTAPGGTITKCSSTGQVDTHWALLGDDIVNTNPGNMGIGVSAPANVLSVGNGSPGGALGINNDGDLIVTGGTDNIWSIIKNSNEVMHIDNSNNIIMGTGATAVNVGIGVTNPTELFSVGTPANANFTVNAEGDVNVTGGTDSRWSLSKNSKEVMAIEPSGNVVMGVGPTPVNFGVGVMAPSNVFSVGNETVGGAFNVNNAGDLHVTGGADGLWGLYKNGVSIFGVDVANIPSFYQPLHVPQICIGANCRTTFATQTCAAGETIIATNADGTVQCASASSLVGSNPSCPNGYFLSGYSATGVPDCRPLPNGACGVGEYISSVNAATGALTCKPIPPDVNVSSCTGTQVLVGVSNMTPQCVETKAGLANLRCAGDEIMKGFDGAGNPICSSSTFQVVPDGDIAVTGGGDSRWGFYKNGSEVYAVDAANNVVSNYNVYAPAFVAPTVCINGDCRGAWPSSNAANFSCPAGQAVTGFNAAGTPTCGSSGIPNCRVVLDTWDNDNCTGNHQVQYGTWTSGVAGIQWTPYNRNPGDIACMRAAIECQ